MTIESYLKKLWNNKKLVYIIVSSMVFTIVAHGFVMFNKYAYHDEASNFMNIGETISSGRWMLEIFWLIQRVFRGEMWSTPVVNVLITVFAIAITSYLVCNLLDINSKFLCILATGMLITWPSITGIFAYMFTAPYYYLGLLIGVFGTYLWIKNKTILNSVIGTILMACAVGTYQSNLGVLISILVLNFIAEVYKSEDTNWATYIKKALYNIAVCLLTLIEYLAITYLSLKITGQQLSDYQGVSNFGMTSISGYIQRIIFAYSQFFNPYLWTNISTFYFRNKYYFTATLIISAILLCVILKVQLKEKKISKAIQIILPILTLPLATNFLFFMCETYHGLMTFSEVFIFFFFIWEYRIIADKNKYICCLKQMMNFLIILILIGNIRLSNVCYMKAEVVKEQEISYYTRLITRIEECEGYSSGMPIAYVNEKNKYNTNIATAPEFSNICLMGYGEYNLINSRGWRYFAKFWCGWNPEEVDASLYEDNDYVKSMPHYPEVGSIEVIDGVVVVNF